MTALRSRAGGAIVTLAITGLALATAWIHLGLGGMLFTLNAAGYAVLAVVFMGGAFVSHPLLERFAWVRHFMLAGYTLTTIVGWAVMGPYFGLAYLTKAIEVVLLIAISLDVIRLFSSPLNMARIAWSSLPRLSTEQRVAA